MSEDKTIDELLDELDLANAMERHEEYMKCRELEKQTYHEHMKHLKPSNLITASTILGIIHSTVAIIAFILLIMALSNGTI